MILRIGACFGHEGLDVDRVDRDITAHNQVHHLSYIVLSTACPCLIKSPSPAPNPCSAWSMF